MAVACGEKPIENAEVKLTTTMGEITVRLSDLTPGHRDNFLQLTEEGYFDGLL
ncbi:MAG: peptidylprolyl isomerase, partial [Alistipes sp.]|nr:peptidylprolyl isomerase [Alistipes sp.]